MRQPCRGVGCTTHIVSKKRQIASPALLLSVRPLRLCRLHRTRARSVPYDDDRRSAHLLGRFCPAVEWTMAADPHGRRAKSFHADDVHLQLHEYIDALKWKSDRMHVISMFTSRCESGAGDRARKSARHAAAGACLRKERHLPPRQHPPPSPGGRGAAPRRARAAARQARGLLDNQIVIIAPIFNVDGTDTFVNKTDHSAASRHTYSASAKFSRGSQSRRCEAQYGRSERALPSSQPVGPGSLSRRTPDGSRQPRLREHVRTTTARCASGPRDYVHDKLFPAVRDQVRKEFGLEVFTHALLILRGRRRLESRPGRVDRRGEVVINDFGLRNRWRSSRRPRSADLRAAHLRTVCVHHGTLNIRTLMLRNPRGGEAGRR